MKLTLPIALAALTLVASLDGPSHAAEPPPPPTTSKYAGRILFASTAIPADLASEDAVLDAIELGQPLHLRYFTRDAAAKLTTRCSGAKQERRLKLRATLGGAKPIYLDVITLAPDAHDRQLTGTAAPDASLGLTSPTNLDDHRTDLDVIFTWNGSLIPRLVDGDNQVLVEVMLDCGSGSADDPIAASGSLRIKVGPGAKEAYAKAYGPHLSKSAIADNKTVIATALDALRSSFPDHVFLDGVIYAKEWTISRAVSSGTPLRRKAYAWVVSRMASEVNPLRCDAWDVELKQAANARGFDPEVSVAPTGLYSKFEVPCPAPGK